MGDEVRADGPMTCEVCGKEFPTRAAVQEHEREDHAEGRPADLTRRGKRRRRGPWAGGPESGTTPVGPEQRGND